MINFILYSIAALIWGSTWLAIKYQLGVVDPIVSVAYRFGLSGILLLLYCRIAGLSLKYSWRDHLLIAAQGILLFGVNYWLIYIAEGELTSGLVAVVSSMIVVFNIINSAIIMRTPLRTHVIFGALTGLAGIILIFKDEVFNFSFANQSSLALVLCFVAAFFSSLGNVSSAYNQRRKLPVIQTNGFGMFYGALIMLSISVAMGKPLNFDYSFGYMASLFYLALFGSIIAFSCYLTVVGRIGADKAGYISLIFPMIALVLSTIFEGFTWTANALFGVVLILGGNFLVILRKRKNT